MHRQAADAMDELLATAAKRGGGQRGGQMPPETRVLNTESECRGRDSNPYSVAATSPSSWRVYQFHHLGAGER